jgi:catalase
MTDMDDGLATDFGKEIDDGQTSQIAGPRGPVPMQDMHLLAPPPGEGR